MSSETVILANLSLGNQGTKKCTLQQDISNRLIFQFHFFMNGIFILDT